MFCPDCGSDCVTLDDEGYAYCEDCELAWDPAEEPEDDYPPNASFYDDNFGHWEIEDEDDLRFYREVQRESVEKTCSICGRTVRLRPQYDKCNSCADMIERGY